MVAPYPTLTAPGSVNALTEPGQRGVVRVLGGPGTGKTELLIRTAATHIAAGTDPESVLLLTGSARLGSRVRGAITSALLGDSGQVTREPLVRTLHSYAFAVLRQAAQRAGDPPPRLITSAEQDGIIRELLAGDLEDGDDASVVWPLQLRPALATAGFATELRDLLARCTERGVDAADLRRIGRKAGRPEWVAAGRFAQVYEQVMLLRSAVGMAAPQATVPALGAAELVGAALEAFAIDPALLDAERSRIKLLLVDDAQHLDPQAALLVRVLAAGAQLTVIAGDPSQTVFGYRGAEPTLLYGPEDQPRVVLTESHRCAPAVAGAVAAVARRLPGVDASRALVSAAEVAAGEPGSLTVRIAGSPHAESALIADALRRAHLVDGVPWSQMAVIVRSVPRAGTALARALTAAGVPVEQQADTAPPAQHPAVFALLTALDCAAETVTGDRALALLTGPIGRVDPVSLRQLRRALRRADGTGREFGELLVEVLTGTAERQLPDQLARPVRRVRAVLDAARRSAAAGQDPRFVLWEAWQHSGLSRRWQAAAGRPGSAGVAAGADLDAITALFDTAEKYVARTAAASLTGLIDHVRALSWSGSMPEGAEPDGVAVLSAHAALGREWDFVVIAGLQEGLWPNTVPRGGVLGTQQLLDIVDGVGEVRGMSATAPLLAEERRLLVAALGRARNRVLVTAVDSDNGDEALLPSTFCDELAALAGGTDADKDEPPVHAPAVLSPSALVGRLRSVVCAPDGAVDEADRLCAAAQLARLAAAGISGADPAQWYASTALSTEEPLWAGDGHTVTLSPSTVQTLTDCPLRWLLERHGGGDGRDLRSALGSLVHALVADSGRSESQLLNELEKVWQELPFGSNWYADNELDRYRAMLATFTTWRQDSRAELTEVGTELEVSGVIAEAPDGPQVQVRGRIDRLERDRDGRLVVVDVKTGKSPATKADAQQHAQLALYQLAIAEGVVPQGDQPGGGRLIYPAKPAKTGATEREQDPMSESAQAEWRQRVTDAAVATAGPQFVARAGAGCANCPVRAMCPAQGTKGGCA
ncbi:ATP-dependent helicase [Mycobacterium sp. CBMA293]|uniref:ATP-dependent helicase n=1 Tax=unclassified Mycolicibacterium TaxID=2636767 RepID=UPI0012DBE454|nr:MULTISPECIES: ATP-dependent DNA helicase [unclassified Mycolicibacterium]MUL46914.1 ATP-dependent helicase [Mycolicibacterium sp. CBMA 360]MUL57300.1 ATP-dependent helicase [Mycolicibacterium sp. CBMA 335]MUL70340.1 ATP-dependent helicase [Mycolicibacterium sp. CBMA 311]MUL92388.1 ATP-dependent helicase [Mycolicibacterium sp. CBMA 230]MUM04310.1 ATP-dependent DNA helicase [Mycolicibacterium sp. CBMA 213]